MRSVLPVLCALAATCSAVVIHGRATQPTGWLTDLLEPYPTYHSRYLALGCQAKHDTPFFDECCHPLLRSQSLNSRPAECLPVSPANSAAISTFTPLQPLSNPNTPDATSSAPAPPPTAAPADTPSAPLSKPKSKEATSSSTLAVNSGGFATYFFQNGVPGACGTVHQDTDLIAAIDEARYGNSGKRSSLCGKKVKITNPANKKSVTVTIADDCPTCNNANSIDLSTGAFGQIAKLDQGIVPITWSFV